MRNTPTKPVQVSWCLTSVGYKGTICSKILKETLWMFNNKKMQRPINKKLKYHNPFITLATAVCLYIRVTNPMTWVKGFSVVSTPDLSPFISLSHSAKLAEASCKGRAKTVKLRLLFPSSYLRYHFWDIKGKTINGAVGCPTFLGRERKEKTERKMENSHGGHPLLLGCYVRWVTSISQL